MEDEACAEKECFDGKGEMKYNSYTEAQTRNLLGWDDGCSVDVYSRALG